MLSKSLRQHAAARGLTDELLREFALCRENLNDGGHPRVPKTKAALRREWQKYFHVKVSAAAARQGPDGEPRAAPAPEDPEHFDVEALVGTDDAVLASAIWKAIQMYMAVHGYK